MNPISDDVYNHMTHGIRKRPIELTRSIYKNPKLRYNDIRYKQILHMLKRLQKCKLVMREYERGKTYYTKL